MLNLAFECTDQVECQVDTEDEFNEGTSIISGGVLQWNNGGSECRAVLQLSL